MPTHEFQTSASAREADADERLLSLLKEVELECGDISASQEHLLVRSSFLGRDGGREEEEPEVFSTPLAQGSGQQSQQSQHGQGDGEEDAITMCTLPFSESSPSPSRALLEDHEEEEGVADSKAWTKEPRKPRVCARKVRGAKIRTPTPSPSPDCGSVVVDPLYKAVLMIPTAPAPTVAGDLLTLARQRGIF